MADAVRPADEVDDRSLLLTLNEAYQILKDPERRRAYDERLARERRWRDREEWAEQRRREASLVAEAAHEAWAARQEANRREQAEAASRRAELQQLADRRRAEAELAEAEKRLTLLDEARAGRPMNAFEKLQLYGMFGLFVGWLAFAVVAAWFRDAPDDALSGLETTAAVLVAVFATTLPYLITEAVGALARAALSRFGSR